jgi:hypothetical protein
VVINDGLTIVSDVANTFPFNAVNVQNVGCDATIAFPCALPGEPTRVIVQAGGAVSGSLQVFETSTIDMQAGSVGLLTSRDATRIIGKSCWVRRPHDGAPSLSPQLTLQSGYSSRNSNPSARRISRLCRPFERLPLDGTRLAFHESSMGFVAARGAFFG